MLSRDSFLKCRFLNMGEAPISVSGIGDNFVDLTIRRVGKVTNEVLNIMWVILFCCVVPMGMDSMYQTMQVRTSSSWLAELVYRLFEEWWITFSIIQSSGAYDSDCRLQNVATFFSATI